MTGTDNIRFTFTKDERLKSRKRIDELFRLKLFIQTPLLRIYYAETALDPGFPAQFAFAVPKKIFPHATDRNRAKRLMRESVRLLKPAFYQSLQEKNKQLILLLSYQGKKVVDFEEVNTAVTQLLQKLLNEKTPEKKDPAI